MNAWLRGAISLSICWYLGTTCISIHGGLQCIQLHSHQWSYIILKIQSTRFFVGIYGCCIINLLHNKDWTTTSADQSLFHFAQPLCSYHAGQYIRWLSFILFVGGPVHGHHCALHFVDEATKLHILGLSSLLCIHIWCFFVGHQPNHMLIPLWIVYMFPSMPMTVTLIVQASILSPAIPANQQY